KSEDCVWKFARAKLWISFIEQGTTLSIPFDIFPTPIAVVLGMYFLSIGNHASRALRYVHKMKFEEKEKGSR
ncbi:short transient receptor potential channel 3, partial [Biomphalaria glabrata]